MPPPLELALFSSQPICYASRTLSPTEKNYSQLDKEALSIIFGVTRFQQYLFGRHFTILTDHKPLIYLFNPHRSVPQMVSACIQRWSLILGAHSYNIHYQPGKDHGNVIVSVAYHCQYILSKYQYLEMSFHFLWLQNHCPSTLLEALRKLHVAHPGICQMKSLARGYVRPFSWEDVPSSCRCTQ